jgi:membrane protein required for colicin V production
MTPILLDTAVIIVILLSVIVAFFRGFVKEVLTIVNLLGAAVAAWYLGGQFAPQFQKWMGAGQKVADGEKAHKVLGLVTPEVAGTFLSYFTVFFITLIILGLAGMAIAASVKAMGLGPLDKALGMVFGALRGFLLVLLIYVPFAYFMPPDKKKYPDWVEESMSFVALDASYNWLEKYMGEKKEELADRAGDDKPDGPFTRRLKKMEDDLLRKQTPPDEAPYEDVTDDIHSEILSDDESHNHR